MHRNPRWPPLAPRNSAIHDEQIIRRSLMRQFLNPDPTNGAHAAAFRPVMDELAGLLQAVRLRP